MKQIQANIEQTFQCCITITVLSRFTQAQGLKFKACPSKMKQNELHSCWRIESSPIKSSPKRKQAIQLILNSITQSIQEFTSKQNNLRTFKGLGNKLFNLMDLCKPSLRLCKWAFLHSDSDTVQQSCGSQTCNLMLTSTMPLQ